VFHRNRHSTPTDFEILKFKYIEVTTLTFQGHVTSSITWPFDSQYVVSYRCSVDTFFLSSTVTKIFWSACPILNQACTFPLKLAWHKFWVVEGGIRGFTIFQHSGFSGPRETSFEPWTAIIGQQATLWKCFNAPIENALRRCQFGVKWDENRGTRYWILAPNELVLSFQAPRVCATFHQNRIKIATERARTATVPHTQRWHRWSYNLSYGMLWQWDR